MLSDRNWNGYAQYMNKYLGNWTGPSFIRTGPWLFLVGGGRMGRTIPVQEDVRVMKVVNIKMIEKIWIACALPLPLNWCKLLVKSIVALPNLAMTVISRFLFDQRSAF